MTNSFNNDRPDWLRIALADIAEKAKVPDMRQRAIDNSSHLGRRRTVLAVAAAIIVVALGTTGAVRLIAQSDDPLPGRSPTPIVSQSPAPIVSQSSAPQRTTPAPQEPSGDDLPGTAYYLSGGPGTLELHGLTANDDRRVPITFDAGICPHQSIVVSPDGRQVAWIASSKAGDMAGDIMVAATDGTVAARLVHRNASCVGNALMWTADSASLYFRENVVDHTLELSMLAVRTGAVTSVSQQGVPSANGRFWAEQNFTTDEVTIRSASGSVAHTFIYRPSNDFGFGWIVRAVSPDGRYITVGAKGTDPSRHLDGAAVIDAASGKQVSLPVAGESSTTFLVDGRVLIEKNDGHQTVLTLMRSAAGPVIGRLTLTTPAAAGMLLGYTG